MRSMCGLNCSDQQIHIMARFILFVFFAATIFIVGINFVVGFLRRLFGFSTQSTKKTFSRSETEKNKEIYNHDGTVVYRGQAGMTGQSDVSDAEQVQTKD